MEVKDILFNPQGRIGRKDFWIGWAITFGVSVASGMIPFIGIIIAIGLIYVQVCVWGKRLHDMGKSAWLVLAPMFAPLLIILIGAAIGFSGGGSVNNDAGMMVFVAAVGLGLILAIGLLVWAGATPGQDGPNTYGPDPRAPAVSTAETFT